jgi:creatinine amidohydrolase
MPKYRYEELTWPEVKTAVAEQKVVLIPVGTIEQHGPHLPLAVDVITSSTVCERAAAAVPDLALVMPPISYAFNEHHMDFPGTIAVDAHHFIDYVTDVGTSVARHGFRKIVLVNGHGSNVPFLDICARLITNSTDAIAAMAPWWGVVPREVWERVRQSEFPGGVAHACEIETSMLLYLRPDLVDMSKAVKEIAFQKSKYFWWDLMGSSGIQFQEWFSRYTGTGIVGDPTLATAEKGQAVVEAAVAGIIDLVRDIHQRTIAPRVDHH